MVNFDDFIGAPQTAVVINMSSFIRVVIFLSFRHNWCLIRKSRKIYLGLQIACCVI